MSVCLCAGGGKRGGGPLTSTAHIDHGVVLVFKHDLSLLQHQLEDLMVVCNTSAHHIQVVTETQQVVLVGLWHLQVVVFRALNPPQAVGSVVC